MTPADPFRFFDLRVVRTTDLGPTLVRITFRGRQLTDLVSGGRDQRLKLFLPHPYQDVPVVPTGAGRAWQSRWRAMNPRVRAIMRSYTIRAQRQEPAEIDIDFVRHGDGPASRWAAGARSGDHVIVLGPVVADNRAIDFRPPTPTGEVLLAADPTGLPALAGILSWLPPGMPARAWIEVPHTADIQPLPTEADAHVTWLTHGGHHTDATPVTLRAIRDARLPASDAYAWIAGEAGTVTALRRHLVDERGFDRRRITFSGYWRRGASEEDLLAGAVPRTGSRRPDS